MSPRPDPELDLVLAKAGEYLHAYLRQYTNVVAEEEYDQSLDSRNIAKRFPTVTPRQRRVLKSDLLMVSTVALGRWLPFRDVFEADGKQVRGREDRLHKLFIDAPATALSDARRITEESARYNIGAVERTTNVPTLALELLLPGAASRLRTERRGEATVEGVSAWQIDYEERPGQTLVHTFDGGDFPVHGSFWIDPITGRVLKTVLRLSSKDLSLQTTVLYRPIDAIGLWLPAEMRETYERPGEEFHGVARYSNFRRFQVTTQEQIK